jgi:NAD(P)-dependent dehydrogenase (short-subunit alcohol dehydrogenase family)
VKLPSMRIDGKQALVTGASRGIGLACATALAQSGADVLLIARQKTALDQAAEQIRLDAPDARITTLSLDVTDSKSVNVFFESHAPFDILVNNAGTNRPANIRDTSNKDIDDLVQLNLTSVLHICRAFAKQPRSEGQEASIINISSQMGLVGAINRVVYCATKHGIEGLTKALAWDLGAEKIRVNSICPTFVETEMTKRMFEDENFKVSVLSKIALGELATTQDIMGAVVFLASSAARMITGSAIVIDGGWTAA